MVTPDTPPLPQLTGEEDLPVELPLPPGFRGRLTWLTRVPNLPNPRRKRDICAWWERRRLAYNLLSVSGGIVGYLFVLTVMFLVRKNPHAGIADFLIMLFYPARPMFFLVIAMNICYTAGWITEVALFLMGIRGRRIGPGLLLAGLLISFAAVTVATLGFATSGNLFDQPLAP